MEHQVQGILFSGEKCGICTAIKPKLTALWEEYAVAEFSILNAEAHPELAASHSVFSVPTLLILAEGREYRRYHGAFSLQTVKSDLDRLFSLMKD